MKSIILTIGMILVISFSSLAQANECKIEYIETLDAENTFSYQVNDKPIIVTLDRGIVYRVFGYEVGLKKETFKEAFVLSDKICFGLGMTECVAISSLEDDVLAKTFLENSFCKE